jgi:hypothetical protein
MKIWAKESARSRLLAYHCCSETRVRSYFSSTPHVKRRDCGGVSGRHTEPISSSPVQCQLLQSYYYKCLSLPKLL